MYTLDHVGFTVLTILHGFRTIEPWENLEVCDRARKIARESLVQEMSDLPLH